MRFDGWMQRGGRAAALAAALLPFFLGAAMAAEPVAVTPPQGASTQVREAMAPVQRVSIDIVADEAQTKAVMEALTQVGDPAAAWTKLVEAAPARQVGQPGNAAVDEAVKRIFANVVKEQNDPAAQQAADEATKIADEANLEAFAITRSMYGGVRDEGRIDSPFWKAQLLEDPTALVAALILMALCALIAWHFQRRNSLWIMAVSLVALSIGVYATAAFYETEAEVVKRQPKVKKSATTEQVLDEALAASQKAMDADRTAAQKLTGLWQAGRVYHVTSVFVPGEASLAVDGSPAIRVHQLAPNFVDPGNLPEGGVAGQLVYAGRGTPSDFAKRRFDGAIAVMEFDCFRTWVDPIQLGARAILFVEPEAGSITSLQAAQKTTEAPVRVPRFYATQADMAKALGGADWRTKLSAKSADGSLKSTPGRWERRRVASDWLLIPGTAKLKAGTIAAEDPAQQVVHIQTYKDASSIIPELSPGAGSAANLISVMQLIEGWRKKAPLRPVLVSVVNDHCNALQGEQEFVTAAFADGQQVLDEVNWFDTELAIQRYWKKAYDRTPDNEVIEGMRTLTETVGNKKLTVKKLVVDRMQQQQNKLSLESAKATFDLNRIARVKKTGGPMLDPDDPDGKRMLGDEGELEASRKLMMAQATDFSKALAVFAKFSNRTILFSELTPSQQQLLRETFTEQAKLAAFNADEVSRASEGTFANLILRRRLIGLTPLPDKDKEKALPEAKPARLAAMFLRRFVPVPVTAAFTLDLSFGSDRVGFFHMSAFRTEAGAELIVQSTQSLAQQTVRVAAQLEEETKRPALLADTLRGAGDGSSWQTYMGGTPAFGAQAWQTAELPALTLAAIRDARVLEYGPHDLPENLNQKNFASTLDYVKQYLPALADFEDLGLSKPSGRKAPSPFGVEMSLKQADDFITGPPIDPVPGAVIVAQFPSQKFTASGAMFGQVRPWPIFVSDIRGTFLAHGAWFRSVSFHALKYDRDFRDVVLSMDLGEGEKKAPSTLGVAVASRFAGQQLVLAELSKIDLFGLGDPSNQGLITQLDVMDGVQGGVPRRYAGIGVAVAGAPSAKIFPKTNDGTASVFAMKDMRVKLRVGTSVAINATPEFPQGKGFAANTSAIRDLTLTSASDMWQLTEQRLATLTRKGVKNDAAIAFSHSADEAIKTAQAQFAAGDNNGGLVSSAQARGLAFRAYRRGLDTINDLIKAVVIFLALVIPFCFFVTKLISPFTELNKQISFFGGVFVVMAIILSIVHPAFDREIARTPEVIVLAFVMIGLAVFVAMVLVGRFNSAMNKAVEETLNSESVDAPQGRLAGMAFIVGVNNMKRRRIRTTLTCVTIILVTFTMLSVISVGQNTEPVTNHIAPTSPYNGILFSQPGFSAIPPLQMRRLRTIYEGKADIVCRAWAQRLGEYGEYLPYEVTATGSEVGANRAALQAKVLVGLDTVEDGFLLKFPLVPGSRWFKANNVDEIILSVQGAEILGFSAETFAGKKVTIQGKEYSVVGLVDDREGQVKFTDDKGNPVKDLGGAGLLPILSKPSRDTKSAAAADTKSDDSSGLIGGDDNQLARARDIAFLPIDTVMASGEAEYRMMSIKFTKPVGDKSPSAVAWEAARQLVTFQDARLYVGLTDQVTQGVGKQAIEPGQFSLTADSSTQVMGKLKIIIPIVLAATIIFNTMLGSVIERRREVAIYNAIGLNPSHVMMFFLAESFVFGIVGSVAGYLIGQALSLVLSRFSSLALSLNYSSLSVMVVIFLTIGTVLLSTIYPAAMAAKAAVPSGQRRWSAPKPEGDCIRVQFPFSYDAARVLGVCAYLRDFMRQNSEASTGQFLAKVGAVGWVPVEPASADPQASDPTHSRAYAMVFDLAPAPYDLGVNQKMEIYAYYDHRVRAHVLEVFLTRLSGQNSNWVTVNQSFLESLRKRLLGWRSQRAETQAKYYRDGEQLFATAVELPTAATKQERA